MFRNSCVRVRYHLILNFLSLVAVTLSTYAQDSPTPEPEQVQATPSEQESLEKKVNSLHAIVESISATKQELAQKQRELQSSSAKGREEDVTEDIQALDAQLESLNDNFLTIASEVEPDLTQRDQLPEEIDWAKETKELLSPLLNEIKRLTSRPREVARLRSRIKELQDRIKKISEAKTNITELLEKADDKALIPLLKEAMESWEADERSVSTELSIAEQKLSKRVGERKPLTSSISEISDIFFKSRGRNLVLAILITVLFWLGLRRTYRFLTSWQFGKSKKRNFQTRLYNVSYLVLSGLGSAVVFLAVLFFFEDWVLLTLGILILLGVLWTSKEALPRYWTQGIILLNLGGVREGEKVILGGISFQVHTLNFYSLLVNPELEGARLRLPLQDLIDLRSRKIDKHEPWFPTKKGQWVLLNDETIGKVIHQTLEYVTLILKGGGSKVYPTADFPSLQPLILSNGFRIRSSFGLDYSLQADITENIPTIMKDFISAGLKQLELDEHLVHLAVEFELADASSLNVAIITDWNGEAAQNYLYLERLLQRLAVDCSTKHSWNIPFPQLTVSKLGNWS